MNRTQWLRAGAAALGMLSAGGTASAQTFRIEPAQEVLQGHPVAVRLTDLSPGASVEISAQRRFGRPALVYSARAKFNADASGTVDLTTAVPIEGTYEGPDPAGLFWSMTPTDQPAPDNWTSGAVQLSARIGDALVATGTVRLVGARADVEIEEIPGFPAARLYHLPGGAPRPVIVVLHGADGGTRASERFGPKLASLGYAVVGLPYYSPDWGPYGSPKAIAELPGSFIDIRIDQISELRDWMRTRSDVDADRIALFGGSKGAEFALIAASKYPWLTSIVALAPSDLVWEGWGLEMVEAEGTRSSFSFEGQPLPFMPYVGFVEGLLAGPSADLLKIHEDGRATHPEREALARIRIEAFPGPVMLVAGDADKEWRSGQMARNLAEVRQAAGLETSLLLYPEAGHDVSGDGWAPTVVGIGRGGGSAQANARAQADAWPQILAFLERTLKPDTHGRMERLRVPTDRAAKERAGVGNCSRTYCGPPRLRYGRPMRAAYDKLLEEVCVRLGFCGSVVDGQSLHVDQFLPDSGVLTNDQFADALFKAEGWDPDGSKAKTFRSGVREAFVRHMGASEVDAGQR